MEAIRPIICLPMLIAMISCASPSTTPTPTAALVPTATSILTPTPAPSPAPELPKAACDKLAVAIGQGIYLVNPDGSNLVHVTDAPDGKWLACANSGLVIVYVVADDQRIDLVAVRVNALEWSPDGRWLAFSTDRDPFNTDDDEGIYIFDLVTRGSIQIANERTEALAWSPECE